jgi:putative ABC transport system permease protein
MPFIEANIGIRSPFLIEGRAAAPGQEPSVFLSVAAPGYFEAMRIGLRAGRLFDERDGAGGRLVALVNEAAARQHWPDESPLGRRVGLRYQGRPREVEVVGVVAAVQHERLDRAAQPEAFLPHAQAPSGSMTYVIRGSTDPAALVPAAKQRIWSVDPMQAFYRTATVPELVTRTVADRRFLMLLLSAFAALALLLATTGVYGLVSYVAAQRTREIGVRVALGAGARDILGLVVGQGLTLACSGLAIGALAFLLLRRSLSGLLYGVSASDPVTAAAVFALLMAAALAACYLPARRALATDPVAALRGE